MSIDTVVCVSDSRDRPRSKVLLHATNHLRAHGAGPTPYVGSPLSCFDIAYRVVAALRYRIWGQP